MEKRQFLTTVSGNRADANVLDPAFARLANAVLPKRAPISAGLELHTGAWTGTQTRHLMRRVLFGFTTADAKLTQARTVSGAVDALLNLPPDAPSPPLAVDAKEIAVPQGETWVNAAHDGNLNGPRNNSLRAWWYGLLAGQGYSIREKMVLFWHNHFAADLQDVGDPRYMYTQNALFRSFALGNFRELTKRVTLDPAMLRYLNGNTNTKSNPNENYGRELQELFTIGKGDEIAAGNYTTYTEEDVKAASRVLTGWADVRDTQMATFRANQHDAANKTFSAAYGNTVITGRTGAEGAAELDDLLDMIFAQPATALYICRKLYRFFVYYVIDDATEKNVIAPMADLLRSQKYEVKPVLAALLKSAHFFDAANMGCYIKPPSDFVVGALRQFQAVLPAPDAAKQYAIWQTLEGESSRMQQELFGPPNVAGWPAYYQSPAFYQNWVNSDTLPRRVQFTDKLITTKGYPAAGLFVTCDPVELAKSTSNAGDVKTLVPELADMLFPITVTAIQEKYLKDVLLAGLPDYEWGVEWQEHLDAPQDADKRKAVETRLRALLKAMMSMAEFQLC